MFINETSHLVGVGNQFYMDKGNRLAGLLRTRFFHVIGVEMNIVPRLYFPHVGGGHLLGDGSQPFWPVGEID